MLREGAAFGMSAADAVLRLCDELGYRAPPSWSAYAELSALWGARTDLVSTKDPVALAEILFLDAIALLSADWLSQAASFVDVGAGVGAPAIPLLLSVPGLRGTLVEPRQRRVTFLRTAIGSLHLQDRALVLQEKLDPEKPRLEGAPFDIAMSRATFAPARWRSIGAGLANEVWVFTAGTEPEVDPAYEQRARLDYQVPSSGAPRSVYAYRPLRDGMI